MKRGEEAWMVRLERMPLRLLVELRRLIEIEISYRMRALDAEQLELIERG